MLNVAMSGHTASSYESSRRGVADLWQDPEFENLRNITPATRMPMSDSSSSIGDKNKQTSQDSDKKQNGDTVKLAARLVC